MQVEVQAGFEDHIIPNVSSGTLMLPFMMWQGIHSTGFSLLWIKASSTSFNRFAQMESLRGETVLVSGGISELSM